MQNKCDCSCKTDKNCKKSEKIDVIPGFKQDSAQKPAETTPAHDQKETHSYTAHFPEHEPREGDPNYVDFNAYRRKTHATAQCAVGLHHNDFSECALDRPLELHHAHIEFALQNGVDLKWLEADYPGVSDPDSVGKWVESAQNLVWLCFFHHRGHGGVHVASASDYEAEKYVRKFIS